MNVEDRLAELCKALGHPARVRILTFLARQQGCCCGPIVDATGLAQSTTSQHLKVLKDAGLIQGNIDGKHVCYCIQPDALGELRRLITNM